MLLALAAWLVPGCATTQDLSAGQIGCSPDEIEISNQSSGFGGVKTWVASCQDRDYQCSSDTSTVSSLDGNIFGSSRQTSCTPMHRLSARRSGGEPTGRELVGNFGNSPTTAKRAPAAKPVPVEGKVVRSRGASGAWMLSLRTTESDVNLHVVGSPGQDAATVLLTLRPLQTRGITADCRVRLMIAGEIVPGLAVQTKQTDGNPEFRTPLPFKTVETMLAPARVAGRICDEEWRLSPASQALLADFVTRFREELKWSGESPARK